MSAAEVIQEIRKLPPEDRQKVVEFLRDFASGQQSQPKRIGDNVSPEFKQIADEVFTTNAELFQKLAQ